MNVLHQLLKQKVYFPGKLVRSGAKECLANRTRRKFRIESALCVEPDLSGINRTVMKALARLQSGCVEIGRAPAKAIRIDRIGWVHHPPVRSEANHADVHSPVSVVSVFKRVRV